MAHDILVLDGPPAHSSFRLGKLQAQLPGTPALYSAYVHLLDITEPLSADELARAAALLQYGPRQADTRPVGVHRCTVLPRAGTISPWSSKATDIFRICGLHKVRRVERGIRWYADAELSPPQADVLYDRMTEEPHWQEAFARVFAEAAPAPLTTIGLLAGGEAALRAADAELGLALSDDEIEYLLGAYRDLDRDPTDVELMMFAQANSEHCRHKIFNADWIIDGEPAPRSLFEMIRNTYRAINGAGILSAYSDNAAVVVGTNTARFWADPEDGQYRYHEEPVHVLMKVETHNHPTAIAPYPGAATGSGGEIRDEGAVGRGSKPKAGLIGFTTSHLNLPALPQPWERSTGKPDHIVSALQIMLEGPIGAAGFNNEFGRPALAGYFRTFEMPRDDGHGTWGYHKPVMIAGGVGNIREDHVQPAAFGAGTRLVVLGGPAMLIGLGGGAASSMASGASRSDLDFASVQRDNAEMERRAQEVIDACWALGAANPIALIHDVGAGGLSNALPELVKDGGTGGRFSLRAIPSADPGMAPLEIWCNEAQERYVLAIAERDVPRFAAICERERCPFAVVGEATDAPELVVADEQFDNRPVDMPMSVLFGKPPKMTRSFERAARPVPVPDLPAPDLAEAIERVLAFPAVASKQFLITIGDRSITGLVAREQMVGPWQVPVADAAATFAGFRTNAGEAFAMGERSPLAVTDAAASARMAVGEALTNLCSVGGIDRSRVVLSANWMAAAGAAGGDRDLYEAVYAVGQELCPALGIAIPVGKDSLSMRTRWPQGDVISPLTLIVSAFAPSADVTRALTPQLRQDAGDTRLLLVDLGQGRNRLGLSALAQVFGARGGPVPDLEEPTRLATFFDGIQTLNHSGRLLAYHDRSDGGLLAAVLEMAFAARMGVRLNLPDEDLIAALFAEELGAVLQVRTADVAAVQAALPGLRVVDIGQPLSGDLVRIEHQSAVCFEGSRRALQAIWARTSYELQRLRDNPACAEEEYAAISVDDPGLHDQLTFDMQVVARQAAAPLVSRPKLAVLREQGVNGQVEMAAAFDLAGFDAVDVHMSDLIEGRLQLRDFPALVACGGFSYGDVLGGGGGWAKSILNHPALRDAFAEFFARDRLVLGICNGCQMLSTLKSLVPGAGHWPRFVRNRSEQFEARTVLVRVNETRSPWLADMSGSVLPIAVAHGEGRAEFDTPDQQQALWQSGTVALQYVDNQHQVTERYPANPNGAQAGLAGVTAADGRVLIMMPHPERVFRAGQNVCPNPAWGEHGPWLKLFLNGRTALA